MKAGKAVALFVVFLLSAAPMLVAVPLLAQQTSGAPVYFSVEPVAVDPLTNINSSVNGLETPGTPSPVGQYFFVEIHLRGATADNVPAGIAGVEVHLNFSSVLAYAQVVNFTNTLGTSEGVLAGPPGKLVSAIIAGFYDNSGNSVHGPPYTGATLYEVASASSVTTGWNSIDGLVAVIYFQITGQPSGLLGQQDFIASMNITFGDISDVNVMEVPFDVFQGTLHVDASPAQQYYALAVNVVGSGTITQSPLNATYLNGTVVTLSAVPAVGWTFQSWSGDVMGTQNPTTVTMDSNKTVTATFTQISAANYTLTVNVVGSGSVSESPAAATYASGTVVTLSAVPAVGWTFQGWSGDLTGTQNPTTITMNADKTVTATFRQVSAVNYTLTVNVVGSGTVSESPTATTYPSGTIVTLTAIPAANWTFQGWTGDVTGQQNPSIITMNANKIVTAAFVQLGLEKHDVAVTAVNVSTSQVHVGESVLITVEASNPGDFAETFDVTVYYDSNLIQTVSVVSLASHLSETLTVEWDTGNVNPGVYTISANATVVQGDVNPENNHFTDGTVTLTPAPTLTHFFVYWAVPLLFVGVAVLGGLAFTILLFALYSSRRKKRADGHSSHAMLVHAHLL